MLTYEWINGQTDGWTKPHRVVCLQLTTVSLLLILIVLYKVCVDIQNQRAFLNHQTLTSKNE